MAQFICKCGITVQSMTGALVVTQTEGLPATQWSCASCGEARWTFPAELRFEDAGLPNAHVGEWAGAYAEDDDEHIINCECGRNVVAHRGVIDWSLVASDDFPDEHDVLCCTCEEVVVRVPGGHRLKMSTGGKTICYWPPLRPGEKDNGPLGGK